MIELKNNDRNEELSFEVTRDILKFINYSENNMNYVKSINVISIMWHKNLIKINARNNIFNSLTNLTCIYIYKSNIVLPKNVFQKNKSIKWLTCSIPIPSLEYIGISNHNVLEHINVTSQNPVTHDFFCNCKKLTSVTILSESFEGNCFKKLEFLERIDIFSPNAFKRNANKKVSFINFVLKSEKIAHFIIECSLKIIGDYNVNLPNLSYLHVLYIDDVYFIENIIKTSINLKRLECFSQEVHVSSLFNSRIEYISLQNPGIYAENIMEHINNKRVFYQIYNNKNIVSRDLPNDISGQLEVSSFEVGKS